MLYKKAKKEAAALVGNRGLRGVVGLQGLEPGTVRL